jgi:hypothetical protein
MIGGTPMPLPLDLHQGYRQSNSLIFANFWGARDALARHHPDDFS